MQGIEFKMILGLIIMIAVILLVVLIVINPGFVFGETTETQIKFREACIFWRLNGYRGTETAENPETGETYDMNLYCPSALHVIIITTEEEWERCRDICRGIV